MLNKTVLIAGALLIAFTFGATGCNAVPNPIATPTPIPTATPVPTVSAPAPTAAPDSQGRLPNRDNKLVGGLASVLRGLGLTGGVVSAVNKETLTVRMGRQSERIEMTSNTIVAAPGKSNAQVSDIQVGDRVIADLGDADSTAEFLLDFPAGYTADNVLVAAVRASRGGSINVLSRQGARALTASATPIVVDISGDQPALASLGNLKPGNAIVAVGKSSGDKFDAQVIVVLEEEARDLVGKIRQNLPLPGATPKPGS